MLWHMWTYVCACTVHRELSILSSIFTYCGICECVHLHAWCIDRSPSHPLFSYGGTHVSVYTCTHGAQADLHPVFYPHIFWGTCECMHLYTRCTDRSLLHPLSSHVVGHMWVCALAHMVHRHPFCPLSSHVGHMWMCALVHTMHKQISTPVLYPHMLWGTCECMHLHTRCTDRSTPCPLSSHIVGHIWVCIDNSPPCLLSSYVLKHMWMCALVHMVHRQVSTPSSVITCCGAHVNVCTCTHGEQTDLHPILYTHMFWGTCECVHLHTWCTDRSPLSVALVPAHFRAISSEPLSLACCIPCLICISVDSVWTCGSYFALSRFSSELEICEVFPGNPPPEPLELGTHCHPAQLSQRMPFSITLETEPGTFLLNFPFSESFVACSTDSLLLLWRTLFSCSLRRGTQKAIYKTLPLPKCRLVSQTVSLGLQFTYKILFFVNFENISYHFLDFIGLKLMPLLSMFL